MELEDELKEGIDIKELLDAMKIDMKTLKRIQQDKKTHWQ